MKRRRSKKVGDEETEYIGKEEFYGMGKRVCHTTD